MSKSEIIFSDIDLSFKTHPLTKDIFRKTNEDAIKQSIKNLIKTSFFEVPFNSSIGTYINVALFEIATPLTAIMIRKSIEQILVMYEPRINLIDILINIIESNNSIDIIIIYNILGSLVEQSVQVIIERTR